MYVSLPIPFYIDGSCRVSARAMAVAVVCQIVLWLSLSCVSSCYGCRCRVSARAIDVANVSARDMAVCHPDNTS